MSATLTTARLKELFHYNPDTGQFIRLKRTSNSTAIGEVAGGSKAHGYITICIDYKPYYAHRLAWLFVHGNWPTEHIDHINGDGSDNRLCNLRAANQTQNLYNAAIHSNNTTGFKGVSFNRGKGEYQAYCSVDKKFYRLGYFATAIEASEAREHFAKSHHGEFHFDLTKRGHKTGKVAAL